MSRVAPVVACAAAVFAVGCGGGQAATQAGVGSASNTSAAAGRPTSGKAEPGEVSDESTRTPRRQAGGKRGRAPIRNRASLCLKPGALAVDAGESFSGIEPGQRFPGRERIVETAVRAALIPTVRAELRTAERLADAQTASRVHEVRRAADRGIRQVSRNPNLLVRGHIPGFERAQALIERHGLSRC